MYTPMQRPNGTVLVVEDDAVLRVLAADMIEDTGFDTVCAADAQEAIAILRANPDIRLVFSDINMPGDMDGCRLAAYVSREWPPVGIILTSGAMRADWIELPPNGVFVPKPYVWDDVTQVMRRMVH